MNILLLVLGAILLALGIVLVVKNIKLFKNGVSMQAEIIDILKKKRKSTDTDGYSTTTDMYYPIFKYTYEGKEYTKESSLGVSNPRKYVKGSRLDVIFMKDTPEKVKIKSVMNLWFIPGLLIFLGVVFLISGFAV
jgi:hypothetical protein